MVVSSTRMGKHPAAKNSGKVKNRRKKQVGQVLTFGKKLRPKMIVVMFHGCGDNAAGCAKGWADVWAAGLMDALVVVPESPDLIFQDEGQNRLDPGRDWLRHMCSHDPTNQEASIRVIQRAARNRMVGLNAWLDKLLRQYRLKNENLIFAGFSQGNVPACLLGANRGVRAVVLCGGVCNESAFSVHSTRDDGYFGQPIWPRWEELMPRKGGGTKFFALEGTKDRAVPRKKLEGLLKNYKTTYRWEKGLWHFQLFYKRFRTVMLRWIQSVEQ